MAPSPYKFRFVIAQRSILRIMMMGDPSASLSGLSVRRQRPLPCPGVVHDRRRIVLLNDAASFLLHVKGHFPRLVDEPVGHLGQFRHPTANVGSLGVKLFALQHWVEDAEVGRGIRAGAGRPLPAVAHSFGHLRIQILDCLANYLGAGMEHGLLFLTKRQRKARQDPFATNQMR